MPYGIYRMNLRLVYIFQFLLLKVSFYRLGFNKKTLPFEISKMNYRIVLLHHLHIENLGNELL